MLELYLHYPIRLHGVVLNYLSIWTTLPYKYISFFYSFQFSSEIHWGGGVDDWLSPVLADAHVYNNY
jgi:hypothetical protein